MSACEFARRGTDGKYIEHFTCNVLFSIIKEEIY